MRSNQKFKKLRIFFAYSGDITAERDCVEKVVNRLQKPANESGYFLELKEWRQVIGMGRPQQVIFDSAEPETWDIFVGVLWQRFGSPPGAKHPTKDIPLESGTHEEFLAAYELWKKHGWPRILFYRCVRPERLDQLDLDQISKVNDFFAEFQTAGDHPGIYRKYSSVEEFDHSVYDDIRELITAAATPPEFKRDVREILTRVHDGPDAKINPTKNLVIEVVESLEHDLENPHALSGLPTGFVEWDRMTGGFRASEMIVIAGLSGIGKTALAMSIVSHISLNMDLPAAVFSLGMTGRALMERLFSSRASVNLNRFRNGLLSERDFPNLIAAASQLANAKLYIDDGPSLNMNSLRDQARVLTSQCRIQLIVIDDFQLLQSASRLSDRRIETSEISADIKQLAKELNIPVVVIAQLTREHGQNRAKARNRPQLSDLWRLGSLEQYADVVALLVRPEQHETDDETKAEPAGEAEVIIVKQRNGPSGTVPLTFLAEYTRFENRAGEARSQAWGMKELMQYFRRSAENFGSPRMIELERPAVFDLRWDSQPPLTLRWTWSDPGSVRKDPRDGSLVACGLAGANDHNVHVELADPSHPWLYVSEQLKDYPGKVAANTIVQCLTRQGKWMKGALEAGLKFLADRGFIASA